MLRVDNFDKIPSFLKKEGMYRFKHSQRFGLPVSLNPWYLTHADEITIGENSADPFRLKGMVGFINEPKTIITGESVSLSGGSFLYSDKANSYSLYTIGSQIPFESNFLEIYSYVKEKTVVSLEEIYNKFSSIRTITSVLPLSSVEQEVFRKAKCGIIDKLLREMTYLGYLRIRKTDVILYDATAPLIKEALHPSVKAIELRSVYDINTLTEWRKYTHKPVGINHTAFLKHNDLFSKNNLPDFITVNSVDELQNVQEFLRKEEAEYFTKILYKGSILSASDCLELLRSGVDLLAILSVVNEDDDRYTLANQLIDIRQQLFRSAGNTGLSSPVEFKNQIKKTTQ